ncbi:MAG: NUDIX hydrolase [Acidimicrobiia bacterium]|nr:NUDIX hydrolase [Acidimicrobiia bacterium]
MATAQLLEAGPEAFSADHFVPGHVTASGFVVDTNRTRLLLIHHRNLGTWLQPGGHMDPGEDVLTAAIREVREETGVEAAPLIDGIFDIDVHPIPPSRGRPAHNHYDVRFLLEAPIDDLAPSDEVLGARWVPIVDVAAIVTDRSVLRAARKLR